MSTEQKSDSNQFTHIDQLIDIGHYNEAYQALEFIKEQKNLSPTSNRTYHLLKGTIMNAFGYYEEAIKYAEIAFTESQRLQQGLHEVDALIIKAEAFRYLGRNDESLTAVNQGENKLLSFAGKESNENSRRNAAILLWKGSNFWHQGNPKQALEYCQESLALAMKFGNQQLIAQVLYNTAGCYFYQGDLWRALDFSHQSLALFEELSHKPGMAINLNLFGIITIRKGELEQGLDYLKRSLALRNEIGTKPSKAVVLSSIGYAYVMKGELECALEYCQQSLDISMEIGHSYQIAYSLFRLIEISIGTNALDRARAFLQQLKQLNEQMDNKLINQIYQLSKALVLKTSTRVRNRIQAEELLTQVSQEDIKDFDLIVKALIGLCDLFLDELGGFDDSEILNDVKTIAMRLLELAKHQHSHWVLAETYVLQAKLALVELDVHGARRLLEQAQYIAEEQGLQRLAIQISNEYDELLDQLTTWQEFIDSNISLEERVELSRLEEHVIQMLRRRVSEPPDLPPEDPELLLIVGVESGLNIFSKIFSTDRPMEEHLIAGFLTAINAFGREAFAAGSIERIKYSESTVILQLVDPFLICYVFQGPSYMALQKLSQFTEALQASHLVWDNLTDALQKRRLLVGDEDIKTLVTDVFLTPPRSN